MAPANLTFDQFQRADSTPELLELTFWSLHDCPSTPRFVPTPWVLAVARNLVDASFGTFRDLGLRRRGLRLLFLFIRA